MAFEKTSKINVDKITSISNDEVEAEAKAKKKVQASNDCPDGKCDIKKGK